MLVFLKGDALHLHAQRGSPAWGWASDSLGAHHEWASTLLAFPCSSGNVLLSCSQARAFQWWRDDNTPRHCYGCLCSQSLGFIESSFPRSSPSPCIALVQCWCPAAFLGKRPDHAYHMINSTCHIHHLTGYSHLDEIHESGLFIKLVLCTWYFLLLILLLLNMAASFTGICTNASANSKAQKEQDSAPGRLVHWAVKYSSFSFTEAHKALEGERRAGSLVDSEETVASAHLFSSRSSMTEQSIM